MKFWMIVNIAQHFDGFNHGTLQERCRPKWMHFHKEWAEKELLRLKDKYPHGEFILLESIATTRTTEGVHFLEEVK